MSLYKQKGSAVWWMKFMFDGQVIRKSTKCRSKRDAAEVERAYRTQLAKKEVGLEEPQPVPPFDEAAREFLDRARLDGGGKRNTVRRSETSSKALLRYFGKRPLDQIGVEGVEGFMRWRMKQKKQPPHRKLQKQKRATTDKPLKPATVNRELAFLRSLLNYFIKRGVLTKANPVSSVKFFRENNEQTRVVTEDEERRYLLACSQPLRDFATLMVETGMRPEEVCRMERRHVHLNEGYYFNPFGKTKAARRKLPLSKRAADVLRHRLATVEGPFVFPSTRGGNDSSRHIVKLNAAHKGAIERAKLEPFRLYDLRHTFATRAAEAGVDLVTLAAMLGHSKINMVMRYAHPSEQHQFAAIKAMEASREAKSQRQQQAS
jgi:integrase